MVPSFGYAHNVSKEREKFRRSVFCSLHCSRITVRAQMHLSRPLRRGLRGRGRDVSLELGDHRSVLGAHRPPGGGAAQYPR